MGSMPLADNGEGRLTIEVIEEKAQWIGNHTFMRYPPKSWEKDGYRTMTWSQYANAIDKVAFWLDKQLGKSMDNDTVSYLGPSDPRYAIIVPAAIKTNRKLFVPDGRVTSEGLRKLIESTDCKGWIYPEDDTNGPPKDLPSSLKLCALPSLDWCLDSKDHKKYPYEKTFEEAKFEEVIIIHTSGTTGTPRPIRHTNGFYSSFGSVHKLSRNHWPRGIVYDTWLGKNMLSSCPPQWLGGLHAFIFGPIFMGTTSIMPPADATGLSPALFKKLLQLNIVDGIQCPPHTVHQLYNDPETQPLLKSLNFILFLGAALDRAIGDDLCHHTKLTCIIGSTEAGPQIDLHPINKSLWYTHDYVPENGHNMVRVPDSGSAEDGSDDLYELVLNRPTEGANTYQCAFWNPMFTDLDRIETKELYAPVKDNDGKTRWVFSARKDDLTKLNWLAKFHAHDIEARIQQHPEVSSVFVGGEGRPTPYVIIEPKDGVLEKKSADSLLDEIYASVISRTNKEDIEEIRIPKSTVLIAKKEKPFKRSNKQTVLRKEVEKDYAEEIEEAYGKGRA